MTSPWPLFRGRVYGAELSHVDGEKYFLVVSNKVRNRQLSSVLAVRLTTTRKPDLPSIVTLASTEVFTGRVVCDDIFEVYDDEITRDLGALSPGAMHRVNAGLAAALGL